MAAKKQSSLISSRKWYIECPVCKYDYIPGRSGCPKCESMTKAKENENLQS